MVQPLCRQFYPVQQFQTVARVGIKGEGACVCGSKHQTPPLCASFSPFFLCVQKEWAPGGCWHCHAENACRQSLRHGFAMPLAPPFVTFGDISPAGGITLCTREALGVQFFRCHCEERSDAAIRTLFVKQTNHRRWFHSGVPQGNGLPRLLRRLAMTVLYGSSRTPTPTHLRNDRRVFCRKQLNLPVKIRKTYLVQIRILC